MDERTDSLSRHHLGEIAIDIHVEDIDGKIVLLTHRGGREVHDLQAAGIDLVVGDVVKLRGCRVFLGVGGIDAIHACTF